MSIKFGHHQTNLTISMFKWYVNLSQWWGFTQAGTRSLLTPVSVPQKKTRCRRKILVSPALNTGVIYSLKNLWPINENITLKDIRIAHDLFNITKLLRDLETSQQKLQKLICLYKDKQAVERKVDVSKMKQEVE